MAVRSSSTRNPIPTARRATFKIVLGVAGPRVASSRGLRSDTFSGSAQYQDKVYFETLDAKVVALDPKTGKVIWENQVADNADGYYFNHAPRIVKGKIVIGTGGPGEMGIRASVPRREATDGA